MGRIIGLIVVGLLVGALARLFHRGPDPMGLLATMLIGIASVLIAGLIIGGLLGFIVAILIGVGLVSVATRALPRRT
jgi:uncharacterized membrane protein YeaQ/YmgE (transglycosylase-associated protein family)